MKRITIILIGLNLFCCCSVFGGAKSNFWGEFAKKVDGNGFEGLGSTEENDIPTKIFGGNGIELCFEGLKNKSKEVRWYAAYKIIEFLTPGDYPKIQKEIEKNLRDSVDEVKAAKRFLLSIVTGKHDDPGFTKSGNGKWVAFIRFPDQRYLCGEIWICRKGVKEGFSKIDKISASSLEFSPTGEFLLGTVQGRKRTTFHFVNLQNKNVTSFDFCEFLEKQGKKFKLPVGENMSGGVFEMSLIEWNPGGDRALIGYDYIFFQGGENDIEEKGCAVFSLKEMNVESVQRTPQNQDWKVKPGKFRW